MTTQLHMNENDLQNAVIDLATVLGWHVHHDRPAQYQSGRWATHIMGDKGFPDLVLAKAGTVLFVELKSDKGKLSREQRDWGQQIGDAWSVWRPQDWRDGTIERTLKA